MHVSNLTIQWHLQMLSWSAVDISIIATVDMCPRFPPYSTGDVCGTCDSIVSTPTWTSQWALAGGYVFLTSPMHLTPSIQLYWATNWQQCRWKPPWCPGLWITWVADHSTCAFNTVCQTDWSATLGPRRGLSSLPSSSPCTPQISTITQRPTIVVAKMPIYWDMMQSCVNEPLSHEHLPCL